MSKKSSNWAGWGNGDKIKNNKTGETGMILQIYNNDALVEYKNGKRERVELSELDVVEYCFQNLDC